ncbi:MAG: hypothetical protein V4674_00745 [Patescibacteria group bacterium]
MDILSHGLWAGVLAKAQTKKGEPEEATRLPWWQAFFWGIFPDLFAFTVPFVWTMYTVFTQGTELPTPDKTEPPAGEGAMYALALSLYNISHSLFVFGLVALLAWYLLGRFPKVLLGWPLHILMDIPTHTAHFFPTPLLWPLSSVTFAHGISWAQWWFVLLNYSTLLLVYALLARWRAKASLINVT